MKNNFYTIIILGLLGACTMKADYEELETQLVLNCILTTDSKPMLKLDLMHKVDEGILTVAEQNVGDLHPAHIVLYENERAIDTFKYIADGNRFDMGLMYIPYGSGSNFNYVADATIKPNANYTILVESQKYGSIKANVNVLSPVDFYIENYKLDYDGVPWNDMDESDHTLTVQLALNDPIETKDYYMLLVEEERRMMDTIFNEKLFRRSHWKFECNDPLIEYKGYFKMTFSDRLLAGSNYQLALSLIGWSLQYPFNSGPTIPTGFDYKVVYKFKIARINEAYYQYISDVVRFNEVYENPLNQEVVTIFNNIESGFGIFEGAVISSDSIVFHLNKKGEIITNSFF